LDFSHLHPDSIHFWPGRAILKRRRSQRTESRWTFSSCYPLIL